MNRLYKVTSRCSWRQNVKILRFSTQISHASILQETRDRKPLQQLHAQIIVSNLSHNVFLSNRLMNVYASCGLITSAQIIFSLILNKNLVSWTILISGLTKNGCFSEAIDLLREMVSQQVMPNERTIATVLPAFAKLGIPLLGKSLHCYWIRHSYGYGDNVFVETGLVDMYSKFGCVNVARNVFDKMPVRNNVSWNAIISGYSENGYGEEALWMFNLMRRKGLCTDIYTLMSLISIEDFGLGNVIHSLIIRSGYENDQLTKTALMKLYINGNSVNDAFSIFGEIFNKDLVAWTLMLRGFSKSGDWRRTIQHFNYMMGEDGITLDFISLITILSFCSSSGALQQGKRVHSLVIKTGFQDDVFVGSSVIDMYANCASMKDAIRYFELMKEKDVACWNALISGYGMMGCGKEAVELFSKMECSGHTPDESTLVSVLYACSHAGLVSQGLQIFDRMIRPSPRVGDGLKDWKIIPNSKHYACVIDLLGRAGRVNEAYTLMKRMHFQPTSEIYATLLNACKIHRNFKVGDEVSKEIIELKPNDAGLYVLVSNLYALAGDWARAKQSRVCLKLNNVKKNPGFSCVEIDGEMFTFMAGQTEHCNYVEIEGFLRNLILEIKALGYEPDINCVFVNVSDDVKKDILFHHSEKLAIAFGLMRSKLGTVIRVTKNLRICNDCHSAFKFISKACGRVLAIKDANRFHVFEDGVCSCRDWW